MNKEIELKFGIIDIPELNKNKIIEICKISQNYIYHDEFSAIRVRSILNIKSKKLEYIYTVKTKGNIKDNNSVYEIESNITEEEYKNIQKVANNIIEKYRIKIQLDNNLIAELDLYYGKLEGLITVEVEFSNEGQINKFNKPIWFAEELDKKLFSNAHLSKMSREDFLNIIDQQKFNNNMLIKNKIEKIINDLQY